MLPKVISFHQESSHRLRLLPLAGLRAGLEGEVCEGGAAWLGGGGGGGGGMGTSYIPSILAAGDPLGGISTISYPSPACPCIASS